MSTLKRRQQCPFSGKMTDSRSNPNVYRTWPYVSEKCYVSIGGSKSISYYTVEINVMHEYK